MKKIIIAIIASQLTACGLLGAYYDHMDKCQNVKNQPSYCGAGSGYVLTTRDYRTGNYQSYTTVRKQ